MPKSGIEHSEPSLDKGETILDRYKHPLGQENHEKSRIEKFPAAVMVLALISAWVKKACL